MLFYGLILFSIFSFLKSQFAYVEYGQFCILNSLAFSILSTGFAQIALFLALNPRLDKE